MRFIIIMGLLSFIFGCSKTSRQVPNANLLPPPFDFVIVDSLDDPLIINQTQSVKLWYLINGQINYIDDIKIKPVINSRKYAYYATTVLAPLKSSDNIAKTFLLQVDNDKIDTIYLDIVRLSQPIDREYNKYDQVKFDSRLISLDLNHNPALWVFKR
jgi:hypothetical protein